MGAQGGVKVRWRTRLGLAGVLSVALLVLLPGPAPALASGSISGTVTSAYTGNPLGGIEICAYAIPSEESKCALSSTGSSGEVGEYAISGLASGTYKVEFWDPGEAPGLAPEFFSAKHSWEEADPVLVSDGADTPNIDASMERSGWIEGWTVDADSNESVAGVLVCAIPIIEPAFTRCREVGWNGWYRIDGLGGGQYEVAFLPYEKESLEYLPQYYNDEPSQTSADLVTVTSGQGTGEIDAHLHLGGEITGTVSDAASGTAIGSTNVCVLEAAVPEEPFACTKTEGNGKYELYGLPTGSYKVWFSPDVPAWKEEDNYVQQYYNGKSSFAEADLIAVTAGQLTQGIDARLSSPLAAAIQPTIAPPTAPAPTSTQPPPTRKKHCRKGQRKVRRKGRVRCVTIHRKHRHRYRQP